jgi:hypothetical protein
MEPYGDADPGISADGQTVYSSRGLSPLPANPTQTLRHLYAYSSGAYTPARSKPTSASPPTPTASSASPKALRTARRSSSSFFAPPMLQHVGVTLTNTTGSSWTFIATGFGPDWNPTTQQG